jgi:hypothetical protein
MMVMSGGMGGSTTPQRIVAIMKFPMKSIDDFFPDLAGRTTVLIMI